MIEYYYIVIAIIASILSIYCHKRWKLRKFPGPLPLPIIGNLYDPETKSIITYIKSSIKKYGNIFTFWAGTKPMLVISDPLLVRKILTNTRLFIKGDDYTKKFSMVFGEGLVTSNNDKHKHDRQCLGRFFIKSNIDKYQQMICDTTDGMIREKIIPNLGEFIDIQDFFHILSLRIFGKFSVGIDYSLPKNRKIAYELNIGVKYGSNIIGRHIILNIPMFSFLPSITKLKRIVMNVDKHIDEIIDKRLQDMLNNKPVQDDILNELLGSKEQHSRKDIHEHIRTLLSAGHDTTAFFGCYMCYLLALYPDIQEKVRKEIKDNLPSNRYITDQDIKKLPYCKCVLQEVLRLYTIIPFITRISCKDFYIEETGQLIPANTVTLIPLSIMNRNEQIWDEPNIFKPERFLENNIHSFPKKGYFPFGYGTRTCIGNNLAMLEGVIMMAKLVRDFKLYPDNSFKPEIIAGISLISKNGIKIKIKRI